MADLSTLDPLAPPGSEDRSLGDDRIRETRAAILGSFGIEHLLTGEHKFLSGAPGSLPTPGKAGRIFFDTTNGYILRDDGTAWVFLKTLGVQAVQSATNVSFGTSFTDILSIPNVVIPSPCIVLGLAVMSVSSSIADKIEANISYGGDSLLPKTQSIYYVPSGFYDQFIVFGFKGLAAGTYTFTLKAKTLTAPLGATTDQILAIAMS